MVRGGGLQRAEAARIEVEDWVKVDDETAWK
jgi:hypothetical protein